jgi:hypothetical protein
MQMMDEEFDKLQVSNPGIVRLFDEHVAMHQKMMADQQAAMAQAQEAAKGAPEGAGGGPAGNGAAPGAIPGMTRQSTAVPDIIGGGQTQMTARREPPLPAGQPRRGR